MRRKVVHWESSITEAIGNKGSTMSPVNLPAACTETRSAKPTASGAEFPNEGSPTAENPASITRYLEAKCIPSIPPKCHGPSRALVFFLQHGLADELDYCVKFAVGM